MGIFQRRSGEKSHFFEIGYSASGRATNEIQLPQESDRTGRVFERPQKKQK